MLKKDLCFRNAKRKHGSFKSLFCRLIAATDLYLTNDSVFI